MPLDYIQDKDIAGNASSSILGITKNAIVAIGADLLATIWNSTAGNLGADDMSTRDILTRVDRDALSLYDNHREGVEAASFLAGIVAPQALTLKLLGMVKGGASALGKSNSTAAAVADVFSGTKAQALQTELRVMMENAAHDTPLYANTMRRLYAAKIGENVIDAAVFEAATVFTLNAHPYMEDYMQSPYQNFALWAMVGGGIGGGIGIIQARSAARHALSDVVTEAQGRVASIYMPVNEAMPNAAQIQTHNITIANADALLAENVNGLNKQITNAVLVDVRKQREERILEAAEWLKPLGKDKPSPYIELKPAIEKLLGMPEMMGVDKIKIPNMKFVPKKLGERLELEVDMLEKPTKEFQVEKIKLEWNIKNYESDIAGIKKVWHNVEADYKPKIVLLEQRVAEFKDKLAELEKTGTSLKTVFYRPSTGDLYDRNLAGASALAVDLKDFKPQANRINLHAPRGDWFIENAARGKASALSDADYLDALLAWSKVDAKNISGYGIAPTDLASQRGAVSWLSGKSQALKETIEFNLRSDLPSFQQTQKFIESGAAGVKATYKTDAEAIIGNTKHHLMTNLGHSEGSAMLTSWKGGNTSTLRRAFDSFFHGTSLPSSERGNAGIASEIWNAGSKLRNELKQIADKDGNIYLYRGISGPIKGHAPVEGYTLNPRVAAQFGTANLFKVHIDNVIGRIGGQGFAGEGEILVAAPHNQIVNNLPVSSGANAAVHIPNAGSKNTINGVQLVQHHVAETERQILELIKDKSFAAEEIAARLNTTKEAVLLVGAGRNLDEIPNWARYTDVDKIESEYLNPKNRIVALQGNKHTVNPVRLSTSLDERFLSAAHQQFVGFTTAKHHSQLANSLADFYSPLTDPSAAKEMHMWLDQLKHNIGEINNILIKNPAFQSVDMALRHVQDGPLVTFIGKRVTEIQDRELDRVLKPVATAFKGLGGNQTSLVEFSMARNKLNSLSGWKGWRTDDENGFRYIVQREMRDVPDPVTGKVTKQLVEVPVKQADGSVYYVKTPEAINAIEGTFDASAEVLKLHNLNRELRGQAPLNDLGVYLPPPNLTNKFFSYVVDNTGKTRTSVLYANTATELAGLEHAYEQQIILSNPTIKIVTKGDQEAFNIVHGYMDGDAYMTVANNQLKHAGASASAIVPPDARFIDEIMEGYQHQILSGMRKYNEMYLNDITQKLDAFSKVNQRLYRDQPLRGFFKEKGNDSAMTVKNALLGINNLNQFTTWKTANEFFDMAIVTAGKTLDSTASIFRKELGSFTHFEALNKDLISKGINPPWESFQLYQASQLGAAIVNPKRVVAAANGMMGTMMLRFLELGHPIVNAISVPILASAAVMEGLPSTQLANGVSIKLPLRLLMDAGRFRFNPKGIEMRKSWEAEGRVDQVVRQFSDITGKLHVPVATKGAANELLDLTEGLQNSKIANYMSSASDYVEKESRAYSMDLGYLAAKHAYPGISDRGATIYATAMSDRVIGNYHAAQRPAMFQGSFGAVLGLFQTYMLTYAQHMYRTIEKGQFKALATTMSMQAGIFGTASWPGYETLSKFIGEHMSNQNYDLTTGTYRAVGDPMAEVILYGLPSALGPSLYTRGDIAPRIPSQMADLAIVNSTVGVYNAVAKILSSVATQPGFQGKLQGMMEGLSLQTLSRPIARAAEIVAGESITRKGQTVATSDDVWTMNGIFSRMLSVRPLEEQVTRNALNLHSYYGAADHDNRQAAVGKLRTAIRAGDMSDALVEKVAESYIQHGGSNKGWTSVMNEIMSRTEEGTSYDLLRKLEPDSPLRRMLKDTF